MKSNVLLLFIVLFTSIEGISQDVPEIQRPLIGKVAATWCGPCGTWGWDFFENLVNQNNDDVTLIAAHRSGLLANSLSQSITDNFNATYQPFFYYNIDNQNVSPDNAAEKLAEIRAKVVEEISKSPLANTGFDLIVDGDNLEVRTKTKFFQNGEGEYYLGLYFIESEVIEFQANRGDNARHKKLLRRAITEDDFGIALNEVSIIEGTEYEHQFESTLEGLNIDHLEVISIIWEKINGTYHVVNTNLSNDFSAVSSTSDLGSGSIASIEIAPNILEESARIRISLDNRIENASIELLNLKGQKLMTFHAGPLNEGTHDFELNRSALTTSGMYYIVINNGYEKAVKSFIVK